MASKVFVEGDELYAAMLRDIAAAQERICLEVYILGDDAVGHAFLDALAEKARAGVNVQVHLDTVGSFPIQFDPRISRCAEAGVRFQWFHGLRRFTFARFNRRNHRKLLIIDRQIVYLGGFNLHAESSRQHSGEQRWRDTHIRLENFLAEQAQVLFDQLWVGQRRFHLRKPEDPQEVLISNHRWWSRLRLWRVLRKQFRRARHCIRVQVPYFMPDRRTQRELIKAARRGTRVCVLLPGVTDRPLTRFVAHAAYQRLFDAGVEIYEYQPRMMHAKTVMIDEDWASIGTANLDYRSLFVNYEINLLTRDGSLVQRLIDLFDQDLASCRRIEPAHWGKRPWWHRCMEWLAWNMRKFL